MGRKLFFVVPLLVIVTAVFSLWVVSGYGKCKMGEYYQGWCARIGTKGAGVTNGPPLALKIKMSPWTVWSKAQPDDLEWVNEVTGLGQSINLNKNGSSFGDYSIEVKEVGSDSIILKVASLDLAQGEAAVKKGINLNGCVPKEFKVSLGEQVRLSTCSTDAGITWYITLLSPPPQGN